MVIKDNTDKIIEQRKSRLGLSGDVYIYNGHFVESLESHKKLIPSSTAETIEEAYEERVAYEKELEEERQKSAHRETEDKLSDDYREDE